jgi:hypothetical protein
MYIFEKLRTLLATYIRLSSELASTYIFGLKGLLQPWLYCLVKVYKHFTLVDYLKILPHHLRFRHRAPSRKHICEGKQFKWVLRFANNSCCGWVTKGRIRSREKVRIYRSVGERFGIERTKKKELNSRSTVPLISAYVIFTKFLQEGRCVSTWKREWEAPKVRRNKLIFKGTATRDYNCKIVGAVHKRL